MTYEEFRAWCNRRACDGCWSFGEATICMMVLDEVEKVHSWFPWREKKLKEKKWQEVEKKYEVMDTVIRPICKICGVY